MKALVLSSPGTLQLSDIELAPLPVGCARVRMHAAALNRRDEWIVRGKYPRIQYPSVLGADGCGTVVEINAPDHRLLGQRVVINPNRGWGSDERAQSADYSILGMPSPGTFAEYLDVPLDRLHPAPPHLSDDEAAALPVVGMTAYRAVFVQGRLVPSDTVLVTGIGGGVALTALQFAHAAGAEPIAVTSGAEWKLERARSLGAQDGVLYTDPDWDQQLRHRLGGVDLVVDGTGGEPFNRLIALARPAARIVVYGATLGQIPMLDVHRLFWRQLRILGSTMGSDRDFAAMLAFVEQHRIVPVVDSVYPLAEYDRAFDRLRHQAQFGKVVLRINS
ncbi:MAG: alcohol dehydrogenase [Candidatus Kapaibacterium sp.]|nr:MAG: alcohol dehydrogenase [Candidatus Kapabacteria bacterium]